MKTAASSEHLAKALEAEGAFDLADLARKNYYHDFLSPLDTPCLQLDADLQTRGLNNLRAMHHAGHFDATKEESDEWAASEEGQHAYEALVKGFDE